MALRINRVRAVAANDAGFSDLLAVLPDGADPCLCCRQHSPDSPALILVADESDDDPRVLCAAVCSMWRPCKIVGGDHAAAAVGLLSSLAGRKPGWRRRKACSSVSFSTAVRTSRKGCTVGLLQRICCALAMRQAMISSTALSTNEVAIGSPRRRRAA